MINAGTATPTSDELQELDAAKLRSRCRELVHERDNAADRAEKSEKQSAELRAMLRHVLTLSCDGCAAGRLTLALGETGNEGQHAQALQGAAITLGWTLGQPTLGILYTTMAKPPPVATMGKDFCPACNKRAGQTMNR